jgi:hypothetical protein
VAANGTRSRSEMGPADDVVDARHPTEADDVVDARHPTVECNLRS